MTVVYALADRFDVDEGVVDKRFYPLSYVGHVQVRIGEI